MNARLWFSLFACAIVGMATVHAATPEQRIKHREIRLREAIRNGDVTPEEAALIRQRRQELRKERLEFWQQWRKQQEAKAVERESVEKTEKDGKDKADKLDKSEPASKDDKPKVDANRER